MSDMTGERNSIFYRDGDVWMRYWHNFDPNTLAKEIDAIRMVHGEFSAVLVIKWMPDYPGPPTSLSDSGLSDYLKLLKSLKRI